jgi:hypothetical protein
MGPEYLFSFWLQTVGEKALEAFELDHVGPEDSRVSILAQYY